MTKNLLSGERNRALDAAKGIGILMVVFLHISYVQPWFDIIALMPIPFFTMAAGVTFRQDKYPKFWGFVKRRAQTLLVPYAVFALISVLFRFVLDVAFNGFSGSAFADAGKYLAQFVTACYSKKMLANATLWYVPFLFLLECIYYWIARISNLAVRIAVLVFVVCFGWFTASDYCHVDFSVLPWNFSSACFSVGFYAIGHLFSGKIMSFFAEEKTPVKRVSAVLIAIVGVAFVAVTAKYNKGVTIGSRILGNGFLFYTTGILSAFAMLVVGDLVKNVPLVLFWGRTSFYIMGLHLLLLELVKQFYVRVLGGDFRYTAVHWKKSLVVWVTVLVGSSLLAAVYLRVRKAIKEKRQPKPAAVRPE